MAAKKKPSIKKSVKRETKKIAPIKPNKQNFDKAWREYNSSLSVWKESLAQWQKATNDALVKYHDACQRALESDAELLKKVSTSWEDTWKEIGPEYLKQQTKMIDNIFKETNLNSIKKFNEQWEKFLKTSGDDAIKSYQEAIKRFNEAWQSGQM